MAVDKEMRYGSEGILHRVSARRAIWRTFIYTVLILGSLKPSSSFSLCLAGGSSLMEMRQIFILPPEWIPKPFVWRNLCKGHDGCASLAYISKTPLK